MTIQEAIDLMFPDSYAWGKAKHFTTLCTAGYTPENIVDLKAYRELCKINAERANSVKPFITQN